MIATCSGIGINCTNPPSGCFDFRLDDGNHVVFRFDDILRWAAGDMSGIQPGDERMVIELLAKAIKPLLQLAPSPA